MCYKNTKTFFWKLIVWKQSKKYADSVSKYSHVEVCFEDWNSFSSSETDWGVRFKKIKFKKGNWDFIEVELSDVKYAKIFKFCEKQSWNKYNWLGIVLAQMFNFNYKGENDWFCSEICCSALQQAKLLCWTSSLFVDPAKIVSMLLQKWYKIKRLD